MRSGGGSPTPPTDSSKAASASTSRALATVSTPCSRPEISPPKPSSLEALGHYDGAVYGGEAGDQVRHLEDGFVQKWTGLPSLLAS